jgi:hypothetical protein
MTSRQKTSLAVLRGILGPVTGSEFNIGKTTGLSRSWILKASAGIMPITRKAAAAICDATGIGFAWLMANNPALPPVDNDGNPYSRESYEAHKLDHREYDTEQAVEIPLAMHEIFSAVVAAKEKGKAGSACLALSEFAEMLSAKFGKSDNIRPLLGNVTSQIEGYLAAPKGGKYRLVKKVKQPSTESHSPLAPVKPQTMRPHRRR